MNIITRDIMSQCHLEVSDALEVQHVLDTFGLDYSEITLGELKRAIAEAHYVWAHPEHHAYAVSMGMRSAR